MVKIINSLVMKMIEIIKLMAKKYRDRLEVLKRRREKRRRMMERHRAEISLLKGELRDLIRERNKIFSERTDMRKIRPRLSRRGDLTQPYDRIYWESTEYGINRTEGERL